MDELTKRITEGNVVISEIITDLIDEHKPRAIKMREMYDAYKGDVDITRRPRADASKVNNKLANDYRGDIIDTETGYLFGNPIVYQLDDQKFDPKKDIKYYQLLDDFILRNTVDDLDSTAGKLSSICGYCGRLAYIDKNGDERVMNVKPWECIFIEDESLEETQYAMRYYPLEIKDGGNTSKKYKVEWYNKKTIETYMQNSKGSFDLISEESHMFDYVPLFKIKNNDEEIGSFEKAESLIDAFDRIVSDVQNEVEEFRLAYMIFKGSYPSEETIKKARQTGAFGMDADSDVSFLTKAMNDTFVENQKKTLNENIYKFSKSVDMSDEKFSGQGMTGEARKWKLLGLEHKGITKERKFAKALHEQFEILSSAWRKKNYQISELDIDWQFTRSLPVELQMEADMTEKLRGHVSEKTRLSLLSFIDDPREELERMSEENDIRIEGIEIDES